MADTTDLLTLTQWLSPAFPLGSFAYSHGLEALIADQKVKTASDLKDWLSVLISDGSLQSDAVLLFRGFSSSDGGAEADAWARAFATTPERLREMDLQGRAFCETCSAIWGLHLHDLVLPVAVGRAAALQGLDVNVVLPIYVQSVLSNLVTVAVRLVPLGQTEGQNVLADLTPLIASIAPADGPLFSNAFLWDHAAMHHETLQPKLFRS